MIPFNDTPNRLQKRRKPPVTIIIGIKCRKGVVVACDSQTTYSTGHVDRNVKKLHSFTFKDGNGFLVGEAGCVDSASRTKEIIQALAKDRELKDYRSAATCVEDAIKDVKALMRAQMPGSTSDELTRHFDMNGFQFLIVSYFNGEPHMFTVDLGAGLATKVNGAYCAIGCGSILADFLIQRLDLSGFDTAHGMWTATYAVEEIKNFDSRCGGRTRAGLVINENGLSKAIVCEDDVGMDEAIKEAQDYAKESKLQWIAVANDRIQAIIAKKRKNTR
jgi:20S proteasome alpha/beta subunit